MGRSVLAVVPARGGSKGVPLKNIRPLAGKPLLLHTAEVILESRIFDAAIVSTDHPQIADVARRGGLEAPFIRPEALSDDAIGDLDVLQHALSTYEQLSGREFDVTVMLQPTSPLRTAHHVRDTVTRLIDGNWDAVWTVSLTPLKHHPLKQLKLDGNNCLQLFDSRGSAVVARQQLEPVYHRNGVAYAFTRNALLTERTILPRRTNAFVLDGHFVSIDTVADFAEVERALAARS